MYVQRPQLRREGVEVAKSDRRVVLCRRRGRRGLIVDLSVFVCVFSVKKNWSSPVLGVQDDGTDDGADHATE